MTNPEWPHFRSAQMASFSVGIDIGDLARATTP